MFVQTLANASIEDDSSQYLATEGKIEKTFLPDPDEDESILDHDQKGTYHHQDSSSFSNGDDDNQSQEKKTDQALKTSNKEKKNRRNALEKNTPKMTYYNFDNYVNSHRGYDNKETVEQQFIISSETNIITKRQALEQGSIIYPFYMIPVNSKKEIFIKAIFLIGIVYDAFTVPLYISFASFDFHPALIVMIIMTWVSYALTIINIIVLFISTYFNENGDEIVSLKMIAKNVVRMKIFYCMLLSLLPTPIILFLKFEIGLGYRCFLLTRLAYFFQIWRIIAYFRVKSKYTQEIIYFNIGISLFLIIHYFSCIWFAIALRRYQNNPDYILEEVIDDIWVPLALMQITNNKKTLIYIFYDLYSPFQQYCYVIYSIMMLIFGNDLGTIFAMEEIVAVCVSITGSIMVGFVFGNLAFIINKKFNEKSKYYLKVEQVRFELSKKKCPQMLKFKIDEYMKYSWKKKELFSELTSFPELSSAMQREMSFFLHQNTILNVSLFSNLEPIEVMSIIQRLRPTVFMPGDIIIRQGDKGQEMYFVSEGRVIISGIKSDGTTFSFELAKGGYFGEIALISNSRRTSNVFAIDFCLLEIFSKQDYINLQLEYPGIKKRLRSGLKKYMATRAISVHTPIRHNILFQNLTSKELEFFFNNFITQIFVDPNEIILKPKKNARRLYILYLGSVQVFEPTLEVENYIHQLFMKKKNNVLDENYCISCLDDEINEKKIYTEAFFGKTKKPEKPKAMLNVSDVFGYLPIKGSESNIHHYYVANSACEIGIITQENLDGLKDCAPKIYDKLLENYFKLKPSFVDLPNFENTVIMNITTEPSLFSNNQEKYQPLEQKKYTQNEINLLQKIQTTQVHTQQLLDKMNSLLNLK